VAYAAGSRRDAVVNPRKLENFLLSLLIAVGAFIANYMRDMSRSIDALNGQMAVILERMTQVAATIQDHESRLRKLE
jgi:hypothetical protein